MPAASLSFTRFFQKIHTENVYKLKKVCYTIIIYDYAH